MCSTHKIKIRDVSHPFGMTGTPSYLIAKAVK